MSCFFFLSHFALVKVVNGLDATDVYGVKSAV